VREASVVVTAVAATTAVASHVQSHAMSRMKIARTSAMQHPTSQPSGWMQTCQPKTRHAAIKQTSKAKPASHASAAAVTVMAANAANALTALNAAKTAPKHLFSLKIQQQMRLQPNKFVHKQLLNL